jgi:hypothetical protein
MAIIGKILVLLTVAISLVLFVFAFGVFTNSIDWGWKPEFARQEFGTKIASEFDKRKAVLKDLDESKTRFLDGWTKARVNLIKTEEHIAEAQLRYVDELNRIQSAKTAVKIADLKKRIPWTTEPKFTDETTKSFTTYVGEINNLTKEINQVRDDIATIIDKEKDVTEKLIGKEEQKGKRDKGIYALIDLEKAVQRRAQEEMADLRELYVQELVDSQSYVDRQDSLRRRLHELENLEVSKRRP